MQKKSIVPSLLKKLQPIIEWIDKTFTLPYTVKKITGVHYYAWRGRIHKGMVFITDTYGLGSNLINPSDGKHGAIYFGFGLKTEINRQLTALNKTIEETNHPQSKELARKAVIRISKLLKSEADKGFPIKDDIPYVIEALGKGVVFTNLVKFITTKDVIKGYIPAFTDQAGMSDAANIAVLDLGLPYDFGFEGSDEAKYCFEVCVDAYMEIEPDVIQKKKIYKFPIIGKVMEVYLAATFTQDPGNWGCIMNSKSEFQHLYKK